MNQRFLSNIIILLATNFLIRPIYIFGVDLRIQNLVGPKEYGLYFWAFDFVYLFLVINDPGLQAYFSKKLASEPENAPKNFTSLVSMKLILGLLYIAICLGFGWLIGYEARKLYLIFGISLGMVLSSAFVLLRTTFSSLGLYEKDSILSSIDRLLMLLTIGPIVWFSFGQAWFNIEKMIWLQNLCYLISIVIVISQLKLIKLDLKPSIDLSTFKKHLWATLPFASIILLTNLCNRIDVVMLDMLRSDGMYQSGIYAAGYRFLDAANMMGYLFGALLLPMYSSMIAKNEKINSLFQLSFRMLWVLSCFITILVYLFQKELTDLAYTEEYNQHSNVLAMVMLSFIPIALSHSVGSLVQATGKMKSLNIIFILGISFNIVTNYMVIPTLGALGTAYTTLITQWLLFFGIFMIALLNSDIDFSLVKGLQMLSLPIFVILIYNYFISDITLPFFYKMVIFALIYGFGVLILQLMKKSDIEYLLQSKNKM